MFARDFSECLFRLLVQHVGWYAVDDEPEGDPEVDWREYARLIRPWLADAERDAIDRLDLPSPARCRELDEDLEAKYAGRRLVGLMPASKYDDAIPHQHLVRAYDEAIGQFRELIAEGYAELSGALEEAERNRARVAGRRR